MSLKNIIDIDLLTRFKSKIVALIPTKTSDLTNDSGFLTSYNETDPTVPSWAKAASKPTYTATEVGALPSSTLYAGAAVQSGAANKAASIPMGVVDSTSTATAFTATVDGITELRDGVCCYLRNGVVTSAANCTLNINGLGAKPIYSSLAAATRSTTIFNVAYTMLFIYNSTRVSGGCWDVFYGYDSNTNTIGYQLRTNSGTRPVSDQTGRYRLLFSSADNTKWVPANTSNSTNATSTRAVNQRPINPFGEIVYYSYTTVYAAGTNVGTSYQWSQYVLTLGYSFNRTGAALSLTHPAPVYIKCEPQSDGSAIIDEDTPYVQALPSTEDGQIYIYLGIAASATTVELVGNHPVYCYRNGAIRAWTGPTEASSFVVTYTLGQTDSCDKTYAELMAAWLSGQPIYARVAGTAVGQTANVYADQSNNMVIILTLTSGSAWRITHTRTNAITSEWLESTVDTQIDSNSNNPVTNAAIAAALEDKADAADIPVVPQIDSTLSVSGAAADASATGIAIAAKYTRPSSGIPKNDLVEAVQTSLGKADTAYQKPNAGIPQTDLDASSQSAIEVAERLRDGLTGAQEGFVLFSTNNDGEIYFSPIYTSDVLSPHTIHLSLDNTETVVSALYTAADLIAYYQASSTLWWLLDENQDLVAVLYPTDANTTTGEITFTSVQGTTVYDVSIHPDPDNNYDSMIGTLTKHQISDRFVVTLTPNATDYSGTMDKAVSEIYAAHQANKKIIFRLMLSPTSYYEAECTARYEGGHTYPSFNSFAITDGSSPVGSAIVVLGTGARDADTYNYGVNIYPLATGQWTGGSY